MKLAAKVMNHFQCPCGFCSYHLGIRTVLAEICETVDSPAALMQVPAYAEALLGSQALWPYCTGQFRLPLVIEHLSTANWLGHRLTCRSLRTCTFLS